MNKKEVARAKAQIKDAYLTTTDPRSRQLFKRAYNLIVEAERARNEERETYRELQNCKYAGRHAMAYEYEKKLRKCKAEIRDLKLRLNELESDGRIFYGSL